MRTWWRRNRWALIALPFVMVGALAASSSLVKPWWYEKGFHAGTVSTTDTVTFSDPYDDGFLRYDREFTAKLTGVASFTRRELAGDPPIPGAVSMPAGTRAWGVGLEFTADPDIVLTGCSVGVVGDDGRLYVLGRYLDAAQPVTNIQECVPDDTPGPAVTFGETEVTSPDPEHARPGTWKKYVFGVLPRGVEPRAVRIWWMPPRYAEIPVSSLDADDDG